MIFQSQLVSLLTSKPLVGSCKNRMNVIGSDAMKIQCHVSFHLGSESQGEVRLTLCLFG